MRKTNQNQKNWSLLTPLQDSRGKHNEKYCQQHPAAAAAAAATSTKSTVQLLGTSDQLTSYMPSEGIATLNFQQSQPQQQGQVQSQRVRQGQPGSDYLFHYLGIIYSKSVHTRTNHL